MTNSEINLSRLRITIHIGPSKTGTTTLQEFCFPQIANIQFLGKPWFNPTVPYDQCVALHQAIDQIWKTPEFDWDETAARAALSQYLNSRFNEALAGDGFYEIPFLLSEEGLSLTLTVPHSVIADRLSRLFPSAEIVYVVRDPVDALISGHKWLYARARTDAGFSDWIRSGSDPSFKSPASGAMRSYRYDEIQCIYEQKFLSVRNIPFTEIYADSDKFLTLLLGIFPVKTAGFKSPSEVHANSAPNRAVAELHRFVKKSIRLWNRLGWRQIDEKPEYLGETKNWQFLNRPLSRLKWQGKKFRVTDETIAMINAYYNKSGSAP
jgi:hypothetical protein